MGTCDGWRWGILSLPIALISENLLLPWLCMSPFHYMVRNALAQALLFSVCTAVVWSMGCLPSAAGHENAPQVSSCREYNSEVSQLLPTEIHWGSNSKAGLLLGDGTSLMGNLALRSPLWPCPISSEPYGWLILLP